MKNTVAIILAAGQGTRMKSALPKVLHQALGKPLVSYPIGLANELGCKKTVVVVGHGRELVKQQTKDLPLKTNLIFAVQEQQNGTGHAVMSAIKALGAHKGPVLILSGDVPLLTTASVKKLMTSYKRAKGSMAFMSFVPENPSGYGRVIRNNKKVQAIREDRDCTKEEKQINEVNGGIYLIDADFLKKSVKKLTTDNDQGELYLTDLAEMAAADNAVSAVITPETEVAGINDRLDLSVVEATLQNRINQRLMKTGVTIRLPHTVQIGADVKIGADSEIGANVQLLGQSKIAKNVTIQKGAVLTNVIVKEGVNIGPYSVVENQTISEDVNP